MITITLNNEKKQLNDNLTIAQLLELEGVTAVNIAVAVNNAVVAKTDYESSKLSDGDSVLIIKAFTEDSDAPCGYHSRNHLAR